MPTLTAARRKRLAEALSSVAAALPAEHHPWLMPIWRRLAWQIGDPEDREKRDALRKARGRLYRALPATARPDWRWALAALGDDGGWPVLRDWAISNGHGDRTAKRGR